MSWPGRSITTWYPSGRTIIRLPPIVRTPRSGDTSSSESSNRSMAPVHCFSCEMTMTRGASRMSAGARRFVGQAEVDQEPATRAVHHEVVPLLESRRAWAVASTGARRKSLLASARGHRSHLTFVRGRRRCVACCGRWRRFRRVARRPHRGARHRVARGRSRLLRLRVRSAVAVGQRMHHLAETRQAPSDSRRSCSGRRARRADR